MDKEAQVLLDAILVKDLSELTETDKAILRSRATYLSKEQAKQYRGIFHEEVPDEAPVNIEGATKAERKTYRALQLQAAELGAQKVVGVPREDLELFIRTTEGPGEPPITQ